MTDKNEKPQYRATADTYVEGDLKRADAEFFTDQPVSRTWIPLNAEAKAKVKARDKDVLADAKAVDPDFSAKLDERESSVRSELASEIAALQARAVAAEAKVSAGDDAALDALAEEAKAKDAEIADLKARLKIYTDGALEPAKTGNHGPAKK